MSERKNILSPSILAADFARLGEQIKEADEAGAQYLHIDVMDGVFVPSISFGMPVIKTIRKVTNRVLDETIAMIRSLGCRVGMSIKPKTPVEAVRKYLSKLDMLLVMTVEPGFGGQKYIPESTERIRQVRKMADEMGQELDIQVDGGITTDNVKVVLDAGANVIVAGSAVFGGNITENVKKYLAQF